jgi:hypothetical protein
MGTSPAGQRGHLGHVKPTPEALTYPPIKIKIKRQKTLAKERILRSIIISFIFYCTFSVPVI